MRHEQRPALISQVLKVSASALLAMASSATVRAEVADQVRRYAEQGPPQAGAATSERRPMSFTPSQFALDDKRIGIARGILLQDATVRRALGERFVEITNGVDPPKKPDPGQRNASPTTADGQESALPTLVFEFFSYSQEQAVRAGMRGDRVVFVNLLPKEYHPPETQEEIVRAARLIAADGRYQSVVGGAEGRGLLTDCEQSSRCLYVQFFGRNEQVILAATVDLMRDRVLDVIVDPDRREVTDNQGASGSPPGRSTR